MKRVHYLPRFYNNSLMQAFSSKPITGLTIDVSRAILVMLDKSIKPFNLMEILLRF